MRKKAKQLVHFASSARERKNSSKSALFFPSIIMTRCTEKLNGSWENIVTEGLTDRKNVTKGQTDKDNVVTEGMLEMLEVDMILLNLHSKLKFEQEKGHGQINDDVWDFEVRRANNEV